jgi:hypothetical protein
MRGKLVLIGLAALALPGTAPAQNALGANYNEHFEDVDYRDLDKAKDRWIRLFLPMPQLDQGAASHGAVRTILAAGEHGYKTIFTLKWPFLQGDFPQPGSPEMERELARLDAVLPLVMGKVDILEIGNEPYIESRREDRDLDLNAFYEAMAARIIAFRRQHCGETCRTRLFMGSLTQLELPGHETPSTERWMAYVKATPEIAGVDIHPHVTTIGQTHPYLDYVLPRMRPDQTFIVTEFSLIWWWEKQMKQPVSPAFAVQYRVAPETRNWQVIKAALDQPFAKKKWDDFLALSPWFESRKHYLRNAMAMFRGTGRLAVATYGFKQGSSMSTDFGPKKTPWLINSVFAGRTIQPNADGSAAPNYAWLDDFRALQGK